MKWKTKKLRWFYSTQNIANFEANFVKCKPLISEEWAAMNSQAERAMGPLLLLGSKHISPARQRDSMSLHLPRLVGVLPKNLGKHTAKIDCNHRKISIFKRNKRWAEPVYEHWANCKLRNKLDIFYIKKWRITML